MMLGEVIQSADWKTEKHVPVIEAPTAVIAGEKFNVTVTVGKDLPHPNTTEHHIRWIKVLFKPDNSKFVYDVACFEFNAHGESVDGPNKGPVYSLPTGNTAITIEATGTLMVIAYCNIHEIWESNHKIIVESRSSN